MNIAGYPEGQARPSDHLLETARQRRNWSEKSQQDKQIPAWPERCRQCLAKGELDWCPAESDCPYYPFK